MKSTSRLCCIYIREREGEKTERIVGIRQEIVEELLGRKEQRMVKASV